MNTFTIIKLTETHYVIVDDSKIEADNYVLQNNKIYLAETDGISVGRIGNGGHSLLYFTTGRKITHSTQPLEGVKHIPLSEVEEVIYGYSVEKMRHDYINSETIQNNKKWNTKQFFDYDLRGIDLKGKDEFLYKKLLLKLYAETGFGYVDGFNAHQELSKDRLFTEADIREAIEMAREESGLSDNSMSYVFDEETIIQELLSKTEWNVTFDEQGKLKLV
jgi:hypothetical protein